MAAALAPAFAGLPRVNLMPRSEVARRERDKLARAWIWGVLGAIVLTFLIIAATFGLNLLANQRLAAEQANSNTLLTEIASLSEVSQALATQSELTDFRTDAMATDLAWSPVIAKVTSILPAGTSLTAFDLIVGAAPAGEDPILEQGLTGKVTIDSETPLDIVAIIRSLRAVDGVLYADGQSVTPSQVSKERYSYLLNVEFDQTVYSGAYAAAAEGEN